MERFLYRLAQSSHANKFVLKGALLFTTWGGPASRPTKDIDLLARMENSVEAVTTVVKEVCNLKVKPDGLTFDLESIAGEPIKEDADYSGVRVSFTVMLQNAKVLMQIDTGFGDVMTPTATTTDYPVLLDLPVPRLLCYPRETVVAEKFEAMTKLGLFNSRMKDFYDLWLLSRRFDFDGPLLVKAIGRTFANRQTSIVALPEALTPAFGSDVAHQSQWRGFLRKSNLNEVPEVLQSVIEALIPFLHPVAAALERNSAFNNRWIAPGPWQAIEDAS